jgi:sugar phosphate isomerase/epimerase
MDEPVAALARLAPWVRQIHVKDARRTRTKGTWGEEVPVGDGEVDWTRFFEVRRRENLAVDLVIEREAGEERVADIARAKALVERELARTGGAR